jgi:hypothetical protein
MGRHVSEPDSYEAWQTRLGYLRASVHAWRGPSTDRYLAEQAMAWFTEHYPDPWPLILARRKALNDEAAAVKAPGRRKPAA